MTAPLKGANLSGFSRCEYGPFGEVIRATGPMAKASPFRFSTKYQDDESDIVWYPYRPWHGGRDGGQNKSDLRFDPMVFFLRFKTHRGEGQ